MFKNYLKIAFRNILKNRTYSVINIFGLGVGIASALLIILYVQDELSVDTYNENIENIYQVNLKSLQDGKSEFQTNVAPSIAEILKNDYPEIDIVGRTINLNDLVFKANNKIIVESNGIAGDLSVFNIFTFHLQKGNLSTLFSHPRSIILTEELANKYFGNEEPIGQIIRINNKFDVEVTGVMKDLPANSSQKFNYILPFSLLKDLGYIVEGGPFFPCSYSTFVTLKKNADCKDLSERIGKNIFFKGNNIKFMYCLLPFEGAYLRNTNASSKLTILSIIAFSILLLACINFTNLATARSNIRKKEIGVRKVLGAERFQLSRQFLLESTMLVLFASIVSLILTNLFITILNELTGKLISIPYSDPVFILFFVALIFLTGFLAGIYPAIILPALRPVEIFKKYSGNNVKSTFRKSLIIVQFALSIVFVISTIIMSTQINFIKNFDLGFNQYNIIYTDLNEELQVKAKLLKNELLKNPAILNVTTSSEMPFAIVNDLYTVWGKNDNIPRKIFITNTGYDYLSTFELKMAEGRFYSKDYPSDNTGSIVVNESAIKSIGMKNPIGKQFYFNGKFYTLIGVVKDFHFNKLLNTPIEPLVIQLNTADNKYLFAKINPNIKNLAAIAKIREYMQDVCNSNSPEHPVSSEFLSDFSFTQERSIEIMRKIVLYSTSLALFISCIGLFGLSMFTIQQRTKEICIRKIHGASIFKVAGLLTKDFLNLVLIANLIAWPVAYITMNNWLQNYAYRIEISWWMFALSGAIALVIALATVSFQAVKAAKANPIESLHYE